MKIIVKKLGLHGVVVSAGTIMFVAVLIAASCIAPSVGVGFQSSIAIPLLVFSLLTGAILFGVLSKGWRSNRRQVHTGEEELKKPSIAQKQAEEAKAKPSPSPTPKKRRWWLWAFGIFVLVWIVIPTLDRALIERPDIQRTLGFKPVLYAHHGYREVRCTLARTTVYDLGKVAPQPVTLQLTENGFCIEVLIPATWNVAGGLAPTKSQNDGDYAAVWCNNGDPMPKPIRSQDNLYLSDLSTVSTNRGGDIAGCRKPGGTLIDFFIQGKGDVYVAPN